MASQPNSNSLIPSPFHQALVTNAVGPVAQAAGSIYSDFASLQRHRAEQQRFRNETGAPAKQFGFVNVNNVQNTPSATVTDNTGRNIAIGVGVVAASAVVVGATVYVMDRKHKKETARQEMQFAARMQADEAKWAAMNAKLDQLSAQTARSGIEQSPSGVGSSIDTAVGDPEIEEASDGDDDVVVLERA